MSAHQTILAAVATALAAVASGRVYRSRREQLPQLPAVIITPADDEGEETMLGKMDASLGVDVAVYASGDTPDAAADTTLAAVWAALAASPSLGLGAEVQLLPRRRIEWDFEDFDQVRAILRVTYLYRTDFGSL